VTSPVVTHDVLSGGARVVTLLCLVLSGLLSLRSVQEAVAIPRLAEFRDQVALDTQPMFGSPEVTRAMLDARIQAVQPMRSSRMLILFVMALSSSICFVGALRYLRPAGLPRPRIAGLIARGAVVTAILRTLDGAQEAVIASQTARSAGPALMKLVKADEAWAQSVLPSLPSLVVGASAVLTVVFAGAYLLFYQYYSARKATPAIAPGFGPGR